MQRREQKQKQKLKQQKKLMAERSLISSCCCYCCYYCGSLNTSSELRGVCEQAVRGEIKCRGGDMSSILSHDGRNECERE